MSSYFEDLEVGLSINLASPASTTRNRSTWTRKLHGSRCSGRYAPAVGIPVQSGCVTSSITGTARPP